MSIISCTITHCCVSDFLPSPGLCWPCTSESDALECKRPCLFSTHHSTVSVSVGVVMTLVRRVFVCLCTIHTVLSDTLA